MRFYWLVLGTFAVWRITHLLNAEDGPGDVFVRLRKLVGEGFWAALLDCFYCLSIWVAAPIAYWLGDGWKEKLLLWPALSAGAILLERLTSNRQEKYPPPAAYFEDPKVPDALLPQERRTDPGARRAG